MLNIQCPMTDGYQPSSRFWIGLSMVGIFMLLMVLYLPALPYEFTPLDDMTYVGDNPWLQQGMNGASFRWALTSVDHSYWIPVTRLSFLVDGSLFGGTPASYRMTNILFHGANGVLVFLLFQCMTGSFWRSIFVALLFGLHPLRVESVVWISERKDVLSTFFGLLTLLSYQRFVRQKKDCWYLGALLFFVLSLLAKPMLVVLPAVLLLLDVWPLRLVKGGAEFDRKTAVRLLAEKIPFFLISIVFCLLTLVSQKDAVHRVGAGSVLLDRISLMAHNYLFYLQKLFFPSGLSVEYPAVTQVSTLYWVLGAVLLVLLSVSALLSMRNRPWLFTGWFWFIGVLLPVSGIVRVGSVTMADRFTYVPSIGIFVVVVWGVAGLMSGVQAPMRRILASTLVCVVLVALAGLTLKQQQYWRSAKSVLERSYELYGGTMIVRNNLGVIAFAEGDEEEAFRLFCSASGKAEASDQMGLLLMRFGRVDEAVKWFEQAVLINPNEETFQDNLMKARAYASDQLKTMEER